MAATTIESHFLASLGSDVGIAFDDRSNPREVVIYRPDRIPEDFAALAYQALEEADPQTAARIESLLVAFDTRLGRMMHRVDIRPLEHSPVKLPDLIDERMLQPIESGAISCRPDVSVRRTSAPERSSALTPFEPVRRSPS